MTIGQKALAKLHHHHPHRIRVNHLNDEESKIYLALTHGGQVEAGDLTARREWIETPERIHWRRETERLAKELGKSSYVAELEAKALHNAKKLEYLVLN